MAQERIKFQGDPEVAETGAGDGTPPQIPLDSRVRPTQVQMLNKSGGTPRGGDDDDDAEQGDEGIAQYSRERVGARMGTPVEDALQVLDVERALDADDVVPCLFPVQVNLQDAGLMHHWAPGVHMVPVALAGETKKDMHWWLKRNKVRHAGPRMPRDSVATADDDE